MLVTQTEHDVASATPDLAAVATLPCRGLIVTARASTDAVDFVSRFFAPQAGILEDPVTGAAHCFLAPYWQGVLGRCDLRARQLSPRGGELRAKVLGQRVELVGRAVTVMTGSLH